MSLRKKLSTLLLLLMLVAPGFTHRVNGGISDQEKEKKEGKIGIMDDHPVKMRTVLCTDSGYD